MHTAFVNGRLHAADGSTPLRTVLVHGEAIEAVLCPTQAVPAGTRIVDLDGHLDATGGGHRGLDAGLRGVVQTHQVWGG